MNFFVLVDRPDHGYDSLLVQVEDAEDEMHARLAAYYHVYGAAELPSRERVVELTGVEKSGGQTRAIFYKNQFKELE